ncbi:MAG: rod shape-determining protein, partial [Clostridiales bacterium]|nr:rod shape-determining protein [Clostridiales bacterium]
MACMEIAVEIGTGYTSVYVPGNGIVLREPTVIAFIGDPRNKRVHAVGTQAEKMLGKTPERTTIVEPVSDGVIVDAESCALLLKEFVRKILPPYVFLPPRVKAILGIPMGLSMRERTVYADVCEAAGIGDVTMVENILLSAIGLDLPVFAAGGGIVVNIGAGATEIAAVSLAGVVSGCGITIGGQMMDKALADFIAGKYDLKVGTHTARKIRNEIGSLYENDTSEMFVSGRNVTTKNTGSTYVTAADVCEVIKPYYLRIADAVESIINMCPPDIVGEINKRGVYV